MSLLTLRQLTCSIDGISILHGIDLTMAPGETLGIVGESGSGKSMTALAIMGLLPERAHVSGEINFQGRNLLTLNEEALCVIRGKDIGLIFQEPMTALNPLKRVGDQIAETFMLHERLSYADALVEARALMDRVGLETIPATRFPHELSGGQRQRVVIAIAIACKPKLIIADEPTSALDVTTQAQILRLLRDLTRECGAALLLISHDLAVIASMADRIAVMKDGAFVEQGAARDFFMAMQHPYSQSLMAATTHRPKRAVEPGEKKPFLTVQNCSRIYQQSGLFKKRTGAFIAVDNVSLTIAAGETIGLVGESGSGKSTFARALLGLDPWSAGSLTLDGRTLNLSRHADRIALRRRVQLVFQDPYSSFDPRRTIGWSIAEPLGLLENALSGIEVRERVTTGLIQVGLTADFATRYPHEMSGGQRQRAALARALIIAPELIVLDEPVSALDVSVRAKILDLLAELQTQNKVAYLFITHDLSLLRAVTDRAMVMQHGRIVEEGRTQALLDDPQSPYTRSLVQAAPNLDTILAERTHSS